MTKPRRLKRPQPKQESKMAKLSKIVQTIDPGCTNWRIRKFYDGFGLGKEVTELVIDDSVIFTVGKEWETLAHE